MIRNFKNKNNKGIALVTVMITIMFLSIIATALLYISATNFAMKASNSLGKNNFYETDAKLVEATTAIRNVAMKTGDPAQNIKTNLCVDVGGTIDENHYDIAKIAALVPDSGYTFSTSNNTITKAPHPTEANVTRYTFNDIEIKHTSTGGFENTVKTDLVVDVFEQVVPGGSGGGGVGNMSMLLDSPLSSDNANFKNLTMTGNAYVADYVDPTSPITWVDGHTYIQAGNSGLTMTNESRLNLVGSNNIVYGNLVLSGSSSLVVYGDLTVFGDVSVSDNATLILADGAHLYQMIEENVPGKDHTSTFTAGAGNVFPTNLSSNIIPVTKEDFSKFAEAVNIKDTTGSEYGLIKKIFVKGPKDKNNNQPFGSDVRLIDIPTKNGSIEWDDVTGLTKSNRDRERGYVMDSPIYGLEPFGFGFIENDYDGTTWSGGELRNLNSYNYSNRLMISLHKEGKITLLQSCVNTTWISLGPVTCDLEHCVTLSKIGTTQFNYMTAGKGDADSEAYNTTDNPFNNISIDLNKDNSSYGKFVGKFGAFFESDCNTTVDNMFGYASGGGGAAGSTVYKSAIFFDNYSRDFE